MKFDPLVPPEGLKEFINAMGGSIDEREALWEAPLAVTELHANEVVVRGPWPASDCAAVFLCWFDEGWIDAFLPMETVSYWGDRGIPWVSRLALSGEEMLDRADARTVLEHSELWTADRVEGRVYLVASPDAPQNPKLWDEFALRFIQEKETSCS